MTTSAGLHHVTIMASDPQRNLDFHTRVLGLRLIKKTVNFDDPSLYHFYFGDDLGSPGAILTFFPIPRIAPGRPGAGETVETAFAVPKGSLPFWEKRFAALDIPHEEAVRRFGHDALPFRDPDGTRYALVEDETTPTVGPAGAGDVPPEHAIRGFFGVTLRLPRLEQSAAVLTRIFGYAEAGREETRVRFEAPGAEGGLGRHLDLEIDPQAFPGRQGAGSVHHIAFRAASDADAFMMRDRLMNELGIPATEQKDRNYFRSIYFREPGGVLFEIATDEPGFLVDETAESLGTALKLPAIYEPHRARIEASLPPLDA